MISVVIRANHGIEALAATLRVLIPGVVDGIVGDAVVLAARSDDGLAGLVDGVGATLVIDEELSWAGGAQMARREWVLCLEAGDVLGEGWMGALDRFVALSPPESGLGRLRRLGAWRARLRALVAARQVQAGDLVRRDLLLRSAEAPGRAARIPAAIVRAPAAP
jgi:hypothetical protein